MNSTSIFCSHKSYQFLLKLRQIGFCVPRGARSFQKDALHHFLKMVSDRIAITSGLASGCYFLLQQKGIGFFLPISGAPNGKAELQTSDTKAVALFNEGVRKEKEKNYLGAVEHQKWWGNGFI